MSGRIRPVGDPVRLEMVELNLQGERKICGIFGNRRRPAAGYAMRTVIDDQLAVAINTIYKLVTTAMMALYFRLCLLKNKKIRRSLSESMMIN